MTPMELAFKTLLDIANERCTTERFGEGDCRLFYSRTPNPPEKQQERYCNVCKARHAVIAIREEAERIAGYPRKNLTSDSS